MLVTLKDGWVHAIRLPTARSAITTPYSESFVQNLESKLPDLPDKAMLLTSSKPGMGA